MGLSTTYTKTETDFLIQQLEKKTASGYKGDLNKTDAAPTQIGFYGLLETGVYTNLNGINAPIGKLNFASFDGTTWSLVSVDLLNFENLTINYNTSLAPKSDGVLTIDTPPIKKYDEMVIASIYPKKPMYSKWTNEVNGYEPMGVNIYVESVKAAVYAEVCIYDAYYNRVVTSTSTEIINNGWQYFSFPYVKLSAGEYFIGISTPTNPDTERLKIRSEFKQSTQSMEVYPSVASVTSVEKQPFSFDFVMVSHDSNRSYSGFSLIRNPSVRHYRYIGGYGVLGYNTTTFRLVRSVDNGITWTELGGIPTAGCYNIDKIGNHIYWMTQAGVIYKSSDITLSSSLTWADITPPLKNPKAVALPSSFKVWNNYLWYVEYSQTNTGELQVDGGPKVHRYNTSTGVWTVSGQFPTARHGHSFTEQGTVALYLCLGDAGWGAQVGYHRLTTINADGVADTWVQWTHTHDSTTGNSHYPVSSTIGTIDGIPHLIGGADRPKMFITSTKIGNTTAGQALINARAYCPKDADAGETMRNAVLDARGNFYAVTAESVNKRLMVSPPPYIDRYILADNLEYNLTLPMSISGDKIFFENYIFNAVTFENQVSSVMKSVTTVDNYVFPNEYKGALIPQANGNGNRSGRVVVGGDSINLQAKNTVTGFNTIKGVVTPYTIDLTNINRIVIVVNVKNRVSTGYIRVKVSTDNSPTGFVGGAEFIDSSSTVGTRRITLNTSNLTSNCYLFVQALASQVSEVELDVLNIYYE